MACSTQKYWVFGLFLPFGVLESRNTTFRKNDLFPSSVEAGEKISTHFGPLERADLNRWTTPVRFIKLFNLRQITIKSKINKFWKRERKKYV
jgi:hypothetical protein